MSEPHRVLVLAGEASGDLHGAAVVRALKARVPEARYLGLGGPALAAEGVELFAGLDQLAVMGFAEVLRHLGFFRSLMARVEEALDSGSIDLVLAVDYPGFNLRAIRHAHRRGVPVLYYISPQVWAWKAGRARDLATYADHVATILPFEVTVLEEAGARASFVGHPFLDRDDEVEGRAAFTRAAGLDPDRPILALLPGSREQEIARHLSVFVAAARRVVEKRPDVQAVLARAPSVPAARLRGQGLPVVDDARTLLHHSQAALVKSGTSTLEAALEGVPFVMAYRTHPMTWWMARRLVRVPHFALANLIAGERVVPEVLQGKATAEHLAGLLTDLLDERSPVRARQLEGLSRVRGLLGTPGAAARVAALAEGLLGRRS